MANFAYTYLSGTHTSAVTTFNVVTGQGSRFTAGRYATVWKTNGYSNPAEAYHAGYAEIVLIGTPSANSITVTRAQLSTSAIALNASGALYQLFEGVYTTNIYDPEFIKTPSALAVVDKINLDDDYYQAVTTDGTYLYVADHNDFTAPNLKCSKITFTGELVLTSEITSDAVLSDFSDWDISDWYYHTDGFIYAVFGHKSPSYQTKVIKINASTFAFVSVVYTSNSTDGNAAYYGEGIVYYDSKWWISYEAYSSGSVDYIDTFNSSWVKQTRYTVEGINTTNFPSLGANHIQGIDFYNGWLWFTIHPQGAGFSYRGALVASRITDTRITIEQIYDLSTTLDDAIGEGLQIINGRFYLNGIDSQVVVLDDKERSEAQIVSGNIVGTSLNTDVLNSYVDKPHVNFPAYGNQYIEVSDDASIDFGTDDFTIITIIEPTQTQTNEAGVVSKKHLTTSVLWSLQMTSANKPYLSLDDGTDAYQARCEKALENNKKYSVAVVVDRDGNEPLWYINGELFRSDYTNGTLTSIGSLDNDGTMYFGRYSTNYFVGLMHSVLLFKRALNRLEVRKYSFGDAEDAVSKYSTSDRLAGTDFSTADWTKTASVTSSGSLTFTTNAAGGCYPADNTTVIAGKRYRLTIAYTHTASAIEIRLGETTSTILTSSSTGATVDFEAGYGEGKCPYIRLSGAGTITLTTLTLKELVDVVAFLPQNLTYKQWLDTSYTKHVGEFRGSEVGVLPRNYRSPGHYTYRKEFITLSTTLTNALPPGARIDSIVIYNRTANAITGGIKIGTSSGGTQVVTAQAVAGNDFIEVTTINLRLFSISAYQTLYIDAVTAWNSASIDLFIIYAVVK